MITRVRALELDPRVSCRSSPGMRRRSIDRDRGRSCRLRRTSRNAVAIVGAAALADHEHVPISWRHERPDLAGEIDWPRRPFLVHPLGEHRIAAMSATASRTHADQAASCLSGRVPSADMESRHRRTAVTSPSGAVIGADARARGDVSGGRLGGSFRGDILDRATEEFEPPDRTLTPRTDPSYRHLAVEPAASASRYMG